VRKGNLKICEFDYLKMIGVSCSIFVCRDTRRDTVNNLKSIRVFLACRSPAAKALATARTQAWLHDLIFNPHHYQNDDHPASFVIPFSYYCAVSAAKALAGAVAHLSGWSSTQQKLLIIVTSYGKRKNHDTG
jgi:hypothetical protein